MIYLILVLAFLIRLVSLNQSFWLDEATSGLVVKNFSFMEIITKFAPGDFHPPLYYLILKVWSDFFGSGEIALRTFSVICGVLTVYLVYLIGKKISSYKTGLFASLFLSISGLSLYYSQEARMYSFATFLVLLAVYFFLKQKWFFFSISLLLVGLTDYPALFILPVFWITVKKKWKKLAACHIPLLIGLFLWFPTFLKQIRSGLAVKNETSGWWQILGQVNLKELFLVPTKFILGRISFDNRLIYFGIAGFAMLIFGYLLLKAKNSKFIWFWLITPIFFAFLIGLKIPIFSYFRLLFTLPAFYLLTAIGLNSLKGKVKAIFLILILLVTSFSTGIYLTSPRFHREDWRGLTSFIEKNRNEKSIVLFVADANMEAYRYYKPEAKIAGPEGFDSDFKEIWLMRYLQPVFDSKDTLRTKIEASGYNREKEYAFNRVSVWRYLK